MISTKKTRFSAYLNPETKVMLAEVAKQSGVTMNDLVERCLSEGVKLRSLIIESELERTLDRLRSYREHDAAEAEIFAGGEAHGEDPFVATQISGEEAALRLEAVRRSDD